MASPPASEQRWPLIRDLIVFVVKLSLDMLRDLVLIPIILVVGGVGLLFVRDEPAKPFREILRLGRRFDTWVNLFGVLDDQDAGTGPTARARRALSAAQEEPEGTIDQHLARLEAALLDGESSGDITQGARERLDQAIEKIQRSFGPAPDSREDGSGEG